jgi:hypothetical protein
MCDSRYRVIVPRLARGLQRCHFSGFEQAGEGLLEALRLLKER